MPPLSHELVVRVSAPPAAQVSVGGEVVQGDGSWASDDLEIGRTDLTIDVTQAGQPSRRYELRVDRSGLPVRIDPTRAGDGFAFKVAVSGNILAILHRDANDVQLLERDADAWRPTQWLPLPDAQVGVSLGISTDIVVVGSIASDRDRVFVFERGTAAWSAGAELPTSAADDDGFGSSVAISGDTIVVGAGSDDRVDTIVVGAGSDDQFGGGETFSSGGIAVEDDTLVVGAAGEDARAQGGMSRKRSSAPRGGMSRKRSSVNFLRTPVYASYAPKIFGLANPRDRVWMQSPLRARWMPVHIARE